MELIHYCSRLELRFVSRWLLLFWDRRSCLLQFCGKIPSFIIASLVDLSHVVLVLCSFLRHSYTIVAAIMEQPGMSFPLRSVSSTTHYRQSISSHVNSKPPLDLSQANTGSDVLPTL